MPERNFTKNIDIPDWRIRGAIFLHHIVYNGALDLSNFLFTLALVLTRTHLTVSDSASAEFVVAMVINALFLGDTIANFVVTGPKYILQDRKSMIFELVLQIIFFSLLIMQIVSPDDLLLKEKGDLYNVFMVRNYRLFVYMLEVQDMDLVL